MTHLPKGVTPEVLRNSKPPLYICHRLEENIAFKNPRMYCWMDLVVDVFTYLTLKTQNLIVVLVYEHYKMLANCLKIDNLTRLAATILSQEIKKLCICTASLVLTARLTMQIQSVFILLGPNGCCVTKVY